MVSTTVLTASPLTIIPLSSIAATYGLIFPSLIFSVFSVNSENIFRAFVRAFFLSFPEAAEVSSPAADWKAFLRAFLTFSP
ncbi:MAG: hypothetical protein V1721_04495 [Pseudomonadota bacterium]